MKKLGLVVLPFALAAVGFLIAKPYLLGLRDGEKQEIREAARTCGAIYACPESNAFYDCLRNHGVDRTRGGSTRGDNDATHEITLGCIEGQTDALRARR